VFQIYLQHHLTWYSFPILFTLSWANVSRPKLRGCLHKLFFFTCVLNSLHVFLLPLVFSSTAAVEFCFCDNVPLIRHVITNHVHCAELPALWLYADRNCELCQSASYLKHGFEWILEESHFFRVSNSNSKYDRAFGVITYFLFWVVLIFLKFQSKQNSNLLYKSP
jgi:hypothetical protein